MSAENRAYEFGPFRLDPGSGVLIRNERTVHLTPKAFEILVVLVKRRTQIVSKADLLKAVWPDVHVDEGNVEQQISDLRDALAGEDRQDRNLYVKTVWRRGYQFIALVKEVPDNDAQDTESVPVVDPGHLPSTPVSATTASLPSTLWQASEGNPDQVNTVAIPQSQEIRGTRTAAFARLAFVLAIVFVAILSSRWQPQQMVQFPSRIFAKAAREGGVAQTVRVGRFPVRILMHPERGELYVLNHRSNDLTIIDSKTLRVLRQTPVGLWPRDMVFDQSGSTLFVATEEGLARIHVFNGHKEMLTTGLSDAPIHGLAMSHSGKRLYLAMQRGGLRVLDLSSGHVRQLSVVPSPMKLAVGDDDRTLYVSYQSGGPGGWRGHDTIEEFDLTAEKPSTRFPHLPFVGGDLALAPSGLSLWALGMDACSKFYADGDQTECPVRPGWVMYVFRPQDGSVVRVIGAPLERQLGRPVFTPDGRRVVVTGKPSVFDASSLVEQERFELSRDNRFSDVAFDVSGRRAWFANDTADSVTVLDLPEHSCAPTGTGLWGHWSGDGVPFDRLGIWDPEASSEPRYGRGLVGAAFDLSQSALVLQSPNRTHARLVNDLPGTLIFWAKLTGASANVIAGRAAQRDWSWSLVVSDSGTARLETVGGRRIETGRPIAPGWHSFAVVRDPAHLRLIVDGHEIGALPNPGESAPAADTPGLRFGPFAGSIDEILLYNRSLTPEEAHSIAETVRNCVSVDK